MPEEEQMSLSRIKGIILQEIYITSHSLEVIIDLFYYSIINMVIFGFVSLYLINSSNVLAAQYLLSGMILWEIIRVTQYSISVGSLWNIWSRNLSNMFIAPLTITEYMVAAAISGAIKTIIILAIIISVASFVFHFNLLSAGLLNLLFSFINLSIFAWSLGIIILGFIFQYGTRIQALAWGLVFLFQPLTAIFYPVKVLPLFMQKIAYMLPPTHVFEAIRSALVDHQIQFYPMGIAFLENLIYLFISIIWFYHMFNKSKETGQFAKNEG